MCKPLSNILETIMEYFAYFPKKYLIGGTKFTWIFHVHCFKTVYALSMYACMIYI